MTVLDSTPGHLSILVAWSVMVSREVHRSDRLHQEVALVVLAYYVARIYPYSAD
jgi:hypothetical protein